MPRTFSFFLFLLIPIGAFGQETGGARAEGLPSAGTVRQVEEGTMYRAPTNDTGVAAQQHINDANAPKRRARIGVALEGGGALGLAHVGVLEWFEEHHIPVDYIAGTSMGGLVGGFYATGMSPAELRKLIEGVDWNEVLGDTTPYEDLSYRRKEDQRAFPNSLILGLKNGVAFPGGLNSGHQIGLLIDRITLPYYKLDSFASLPTPFRCVATDIVSGKEVVLDDGSLAEALRATMSIPGAFAPVRVSSITILSVAPQQPAIRMVDRQRFPTTILRTIPRAIHPLRTSPPRRQSTLRPTSSLSRRLTASAVPSKHN